ncbi:hypothetical protein [[Limnothrix rosea] IAM M-220]|uniref:hypothetical protein n=1 Tax=[Limnothrix rosea] IAM M-220 TaxID=454133 RepID=UPI00111567DB|nr:hypothetical protein [[Limnothrix rosea] IAM M-220]
MSLVSSTLAAFSVMCQDKQAEFTHVVTGFGVTHILDGYLLISVILLTWRSPNYLFSQQKSPTYFKSGIVELD